MTREVFIPYDGHVWSPRFLMEYWKRKSDIDIVVDEMRVEHKFWQPSHVAYLSAKELEEKYPDWWATGNPPRGVWWSWTVSGFQDKSNWEVQLGVGDVDINDPITKEVLEDIGMKPACSNPYISIFCAIVPKRFEGNIKVEYEEGHGNKVYCEIPENEWLLKYYPTDQ